MAYGVTTGLDDAALVDPNIRRPWAMDDKITFTSAANDGALFQDNVKCQFGTTALGYIEQDATDLVIDPDTVGAGIIRFGSSADKNVMLNKIGLGGTAISTLYWINFELVTSTGRGALNFDYTYTGSAPSANIISKLTSQATSASPLGLSGTFEVVKDQDQTGSGTYGVRSIIGTDPARAITQGTSTMFAFKAQRGSNGGVHTGGTLYEYGLWMPTFTAYTGLGTYGIWGVNVGHNIQAQDNVYFVFGGSDTVTGTTRARYNTGTSALEFEVNATPVWNSTTTLLTASVPTSGFQFEVSKNSGATVGKEKRINFIEGSNITLTIADDPGNTEVDVTIAATGGGSGISIGLATAIAYGQLRI